MKYEEAMQELIDKYNKPEYYIARIIGNTKFFIKYIVNGGFYFVETDLFFSENYIATDADKDAEWEFVVYSDSYYK